MIDLSNPAHFFLLNSAFAVFGVFNYLAATERGFAFGVAWIAAWVVTLASLLASLFATIANAL